MAAQSANNIASRSHFQESGVSTAKFFSALETLRATLHNVRSTRRKPNAQKAIGFFAPSFSAPLAQLDRASVYGTEG